MDEKGGLIACVASDVIKTSECGYCKCKSVQESPITASPTTETIVHVNCSGVTSGSGQIRVPNLTEYLKSNSLSSGELWIEFNGNGIRNISNLKLPNIDLSSNAFTSVSQTLLDWKTLQTVDLQDNPWHCECSLQWMLDIVVAKLYKVDQQLLYNLKCASPAIVAEKRMVHFYNWTKPAFCSGFEQLRMNPGQSDPTSSSWLGTSNAAIIVVCSLLGVLVLLVALGIFLQRKMSARRRIKNRRENGAAEPETAVARYRLSPVTSLDWKDKMLHDRTEQDRTGPLSSIDVIYKVKETVKLTFLKFHFPVGCRHEARQTKATHPTPLPTPLSGYQAAALLHAFLERRTGVTDKKMLWIDEVAHQSQPTGMYPHFPGVIVENHCVKTILSSPNQDLNFDITVIDSLVYCESSTLDHAATEEIVRYSSKNIASPALYLNWKRQCRIKGGGGGPSALGLHWFRVPDPAPEPFRMVSDNFKNSMLYHHALLPVQAIHLNTIYTIGLGIGKVEYRGIESAFAWKESGKPFRETTPSSRDSNLNLPVLGSPAQHKTSALAIYAIEEGEREGERRGVGSQPTKVSFRTNKNRWITETVDGASYRTGLAEKSCVWKY
uniref:LRRCT domain-containing protein n=1 Tax=Timema genevievae TaxID=629358 RepID=A0A7R9PKW5_TIMGE|nr:unnamed protein product [Timema genevievae]